MKVAIIGAGISGLYLAWQLAKKGEKVIVFEKRDKIGKEICSGLFSERIFGFIPEAEKLIEKEIDYCLIHFPKKTIKIKFSRKFFLINHCQLDNLTAQLAKKAGAKIILNQDQTIAKVRLLEKEFDRIIGCDGPNSIIRKSLGLPEPNFYLGIQKFFSFKDNSNFVETWPKESGFIWKIPHNFKTEYGIMEKPEKAKNLFENFLKNLLFENNSVLIKNQFREEKAAIISQGLIIPENPKITLCGEAAGLTKPWSGGGVIWGLTAANLLLKNFPDFIKYQKEAKKFFKPKIILSKIIKKGVYFFGYYLPFFLPKDFKIESDFLL